MQSNRLRRVTGASNAVALMLARLVRYRIMPVLIHKRVVLVLAGCVA
jgi:hypothetical protein